MKMLIAALFLILQPGPEEVLEDPVLEARAREISQQLRCVVCQSQSIDESNAFVARDLRRAVRERLLAGDSDEEVIAFIRGRYGDYVLRRPPFQANTLLLWLAPFLLLGAGLAAAFWFSRRQPASEASPFSPEEEARIEALLERERREDGS